MANVLSVECTPTAVDADGVCASQSPAAGAILINGALASGGVATFAAAQLVRLTSGGNDSGITFTFTGTDADGLSQSETVAGTNGSNTDTTKFFKTITEITASAAVAGTIVVGNLITSVSPTFRPNCSVNPYNLGILAELVSGTATYTLQQTYEDVDSKYPTTWIDNATVANKSASFEHNVTAPVAGYRLKLTASSSGVVKLNVIQAGV